MAKHGKRRTYRRFRTSAPEDNGRAEQQVQMAAQARAATRAPDELRKDLDECMSRLAEADQQAQLDPSPASLARFRAARNERLILETALRMQGLPRVSSQIE
jgi:hypothetical protein